VTALSPAGAWRSDADYRAIATPSRIFYAIVGLILFLVRWFAGSAWLRKTLLRQTMAHGERLSAGEFLACCAAWRERGSCAACCGRWAATDRSRRSTPAPCRSGSPGAVPTPSFRTPVTARRSSSASAASTRTTVPGVGHVPMYDDPERVAASIVEVTRRVDAAQRQSA
jgi:pimeloyl-ACP methyl ester carboxylesterase